jgi:uncharacterized protein YpmB
MAPGAGYASLLAEAKQAGVKGDLETQTRATGQEGDTSFGIVETRDEFDNELGITAPISQSDWAYSAEMQSSVSNSETRYQLSQRSVSSE